MLKFAFLVFHIRWSIVFTIIGSSANPSTCANPVFNTTTSGFKVFKSASKDFVHIASPAKHTDFADNLF
jgi:hypothetical protein